MPSVGVRPRKASGIAVDAIREAVEGVLRRHRMRFVDLETLRAEISLDIKTKTGLSCYYEEPEAVSMYAGGGLRDVERGVELSVEEKLGQVVCDLGDAEVTPLSVVTKRVTVMLGKPGLYLLLPVEKTYVLILDYRFIAE